MFHLQESHRGDPRALSGVYVISVLLLTLIVITLPVFPSSDGAAHLYYSHVLDQLRTGGSNYASFYAPRRLFGPYALQYFFLIYAERLVSADMAEKLFVALIVLNLGSGFYYLAGRLSAGRPDLACLWVIPVLLPWCLAAGFMNYCFAVGVSLWLIGLWVHLKAGCRASSLSGFVASLILLVISHPVPLLLSIIIFFIDLTLTLFYRKGQLQGWLKELWLPVFLFALSCTAFMVPVLISDRARVASDSRHFGLHPSIVLSLFTGTALPLLKGIPYLTVPYRAAAVLTLPVYAVLVLRGVRQRFAVGSMRATDHVVIAAILLLLASVVIPDKMNGSGHFATRLWWPIWLIVIASFSQDMVSSAQRKLLTYAGITLAIVTVIGTAIVLVPIARQTRILDAANLPNGKRGLFLESPETANLTENVNYRPYQWVGARAFMHNDAVLLNSPWMDITISPLKPQNGSELLSVGGAVSSLEASALPREMADSAMARDQILEHADFVLYIHVASPNPLSLSPLEGLFTGAPAWTCDNWPIYSVCRKAR